MPDVNGQLLLLELHRYDGCARDSAIRRLYVCLLGCDVNP